MISRRIYLVTIFVFGFASAHAAQSEWVHPGANGKLTYKTTERGDRIMDFSYAGYMGGGVSFPDVAVKRTAKPSGADDTAAIQKAIDEVSALPLENGFRGAVLLEPGVFSSSNTITIAASGVVLRGSGKDTTLKLSGAPHNAITARLETGGRNNRARNQSEFETSISDAYLPSGAMKFSVKDASGLAVGDIIEIRRPVTEAWIKFMQMDDLVRDGKPQTWLKAGNSTIAERKIAAISGNTITLDVPLSDSFDAKFLNPPGTTVAKIKPPARLAQVGIEKLRIESPPQAINHTEAHFSAIRLNGEDCWVRDVLIEETMNSVAVNGRRITLQNVRVNRKAPHQGSSKPAEFAPNGTQVLMDRCAVSGDNIWFAATGAGVSGPVVLLNCAFEGNGSVEAHQRWSTGALYDNCKAPAGGLEFRNRGEMGSGHGWGMGWGVAWNCEAKHFIVQNPPGALNWMIGCVGENKPAPRPFGKQPNLPKGVEDSNGAHVAPQSLYLAQLKERLGTEALRKIGY